MIYINTLILTEDLKNNKYTIRHILSPQVKHNDKQEKCVILYTLILFLKFLQVLDTYWWYNKELCEDYTFQDPVADLESPVSCSGLSALALPDLTDRFSEELKDDSKSITALLLMGDNEIGLEM